MNPDFLAKLLAALGMSPAPAGTPSTPKPHTFADTLLQITGGHPAIVDAVPPYGDAARGQYRGPNFINPTRDSVYLNPNPDTTPGRQQPPHDYLLSHELSHRLYAQNIPGYTEAERPTGTRDPNLPALIQGAKARAPTGESNEAFAQAFASALESLRAASTGRKPYDPASYDQHADPTTVGSLQAWLLKQPIYQNYSPAPIRPDVTAVRKP